MRILLVVALYNLLPVILAQFDVINEDIGDFHFNAESGKLPLKYIPLSEQDRKASGKAAEVIDFIQLVPNIDPLRIASVQPLGIDVPFLWLSGEVYMKNFVLAGVKQLQVNSVELRLVNLRSDLNITIPLINLEGDLYLQASFSIFPVVFKCHISANLLNVGVVVSSGGHRVQARPTGEVLQIGSAKINVDIRNVVINITEMVIGGEEEKQFIPPVTQLFTGTKSHGNLFDTALTIALNMANKELLKIPIDVFKSYLLSDTY